MYEAKKQNFEYRERAEELFEEFEEFAGKFISEDLKRRLYKSSLAAGGIIEKLRPKKLTGTDLNIKLAESDEGLEFIICNKEYQKKLDKARKEFLKNDINVQKLLNVMLNFGAQEINLKPTNDEDKEEVKRFKEKLFEDFFLRLEKQGKVLNVL
jgi:hypothetical protein